MNSLTYEQLQEVLDHVMVYTTKQMADMQLKQQDSISVRDAYTVNVVFEGNCDVTLSLCADRLFLVRLTKGVLQEDYITEQDMQDASKEYLNVICGQLITQLFPLSYKPTYFQLPILTKGNHIIDQNADHIYQTSYANDFNESIILVITMSFKSINTNNSPV